MMGIMAPARSSSIGWTGTRLPHGDGENPRVVYLFSVKHGKHVILLKPGICLQSVREIGPHITINQLNAGPHCCRSHCGPGRGSEVLPV